MTGTDDRAVTRKLRAPHHKRIALALQGGGALGAYQAGAYHALAEAGYALDWVSGVSIGAINGAIIAGNPPERRVERLREFWDTVSSHPAWIEPDVPDWLRDAYTDWSSTLTMLGGRPGFFTPRMPPPWLLHPKFAKVRSYYDTAPLRATLSALIDFDLLNAGKVRYSAGAVDLETGNYAYFDTKTWRVDAAATTRARSDIRARRGWRETPKVQWHDPVLTARAAE